MRENANIDQLGPIVPPDPDHLARVIALVERQPDSGLLLEAILNPAWGAA